MPSSRREAFVELFRCHPTLVGELLAGALGIEQPEYHELRLEAADCTDVVPTEYRADAVSCCTRVPSRCWRWSEVQLGADRATAAWCAAPIELGLGLTRSHQREYDDRMTASRITVTIPEQLAGAARRAVEEGRAESVSAYVADALQQFGRSATLRELLDHWWAEDPAGPPSEEERDAARAELGLPG